MIENLYLELSAFYYSKSEEAILIYFICLIVVRSFISVRLRFFPFFFVRNRSSPFLRSITQTQPSLTVSPSITFYHRLRPFPSLNDSPSPFLLSIPIPSKTSFHFSDVLGLFFKYKFGNER